MDEGKAPGLTTAEAAEIRVLRRKVSELERTIEILTEATRFFAREADPLRRDLRVHRLGGGPVRGRAGVPGGAGRGVTGLLRSVFEPGTDGRRKPESLYGAVKAWGHLRRQGVQVARCTVDRSWSTPCRVSRRRVAQLWL